MELLHEILNCIPTVVTSVYREKMLKALVLLMYYGCLRVGEVSFSSSYKHILKLSHITLNGRGLTIRFESYKHSTTESEGIKYVIKATTSEFCPVAAMNSYLLIRKKCVGGYLFTEEDGKTVTRDSIATVIKRAVSLTGRNSELFNTHSLRIGRATDLAKLGYSDTKIKQIGRWKSRAFADYIRPSEILLA